jgi:hypothetical protein
MHQERRAKSVGINPSWLCPRHERGVCATSSVAIVCLVESESCIASKRVWIEPGMQESYGKVRPSLGAACARLLPWSCC